MKQNGREQRIASLYEFWRLVQEDWRMNDRGVMRPGFQAMLVYRFGVWRSGLRLSLVRAPLKLLYDALHIFIRNFYGIEIHANANFGRRLRIAHQSGILVHRKASIGDDCLIRQGVSIGRGPNHGGGRNAAAPQLGNRVEVGANAVLIGDITIGDDVVIGPGAIVMTNIRSNSVVCSPICKVLPRPPKEVSTSPDEASKPSTPSSEGSVA